jgi:predicted permease
MNDFLLMIGGALFVIALSFLYGFISAWLKDKDK